MSRIGRQPISIPSGVEVALGQDQTVTVKGPKGTLARRLHPDVRLVVEGAEVRMHRGMPARGRPDRPGAARVAGTGPHRVVGALAVGTADGMDGRQVDHVEAELGELGKAPGGIREGEIGRAHV